MKKFSFSAASMLAVSAMAVVLPSLASAGVLSCTSSVDVPAQVNPKGKVTQAAYTASRTWTLDSADACGLATGNVNSSAALEGVGGVFDLGASANWSYQSGVSGGLDSSAWLDITLTTGAWGGKPVTGTWSLADHFWDQFEQAVLTFHMGHGSVDGLADSGVFLISANQYSGNWGFSQLNANGGGFSNVKLWTTPKIAKPFLPPVAPSAPPTAPEEVPEPAMLLLLGSALAGLGLDRLRRKA